MSLRLLGRFDAQVTGSHIRPLHIGAPRRQALLAYLALRPGLSAGRDHLASLLWDEEDATQARHNLRNIALTVGAPLVESRRNALIRRRLQVSKSKIFKLLFELPDA